MGEEEFAWVENPRYMRGMRNIGRIIGGVMGLKFKERENQIAEIVVSS
jgi:hypothetical protein